MIRQRKIRKNSGESVKKRVSFVKLVIFRKENFGEMKISTTFATQYG